MSNPVALTVIIRDDAPLIHCNSTPTYRRVTFALTEEQVEKLRLRHKDESLSLAFIEEASHE